MVEMIAKPIPNAAASAILLNRVLTGSLVVVDVVVRFKYSGAGKRAEEEGLKERKIYL